ncbi:Peptidase family M23 [Pustulibacterium marinum]|uniref:Peptidase family M23 n=1 Tax=Pustulibacterium marinum TaxID=1224947 RepID=A0A1I7IPN7_9FLAO|nr:M23 family metallopeptidase [Pustulibacterium marinum]SFU74888.1 Peptidase family M23 [Pustulibacterium marinum]
MKKTKRILGCLLVLIVIGFLIPENFQMPVSGASSADYHPKSFWFYPWGKSVTHKGVDIFANSGTPINSATNGFVLYSGHINYGGNFVLILGPKWRLHYYAHLKTIAAKPLQLVSSNTMIGSVGQSGNAKGKPPHLHYAIATLLPYIWRIDDSQQGWKKMFYLNPIEYLQQS